MKVGFERWTLSNTFFPPSKRVSLVCESKVGLCAGCGGRVFMSAPAMKLRHQGDCCLSLQLSCSVFCKRTVPLCRETVASESPRSKFPILLCIGAIVFCSSGKLRSGTAASRYLQGSLLTGVFVCLQSNNYCAQSNLRQRCCSARFSPTLAPCISGYK